MEEIFAFPTGTRKLHPEPIFDFQLNRVALWNNGDWDELADAASRIADTGDWERELLALGNRAFAQGRIQNAIGYFRMSEFFLYDENAEKINIYKNAREMFYRFYAPVFDSGEVKREYVPYGGGYMPVWAALPRNGGPVKDTILIHGGFDSYMEEFFQVARYMARNGYGIYLFEGPGQGEPLRVDNLKFTPDWHKPVADILDYFNLDDVTLVGISLGGVLAPRAAAFEKRIRRVVGLSILPNILDVLLSGETKERREVIGVLLSLGQKGIFNKIAKAKMAASPMAEWQIKHAMYAFGGATPYDLMAELKKYQIADIGRFVDQDFLLIGAKNDHLIPPSLYKDEIDALPNPRSLTYRLFTDREDAGSHCCAGNIKLVLDFIASWIDSVKYYP